MSELLKIDILNAASEISELKKILEMIPIGNHIDIIGIQCRLESRTEYIMNISNCRDCAAVIFCADIECAHLNCCDTMIAWARNSKS